MRKLGLLLFVVLVGMVAGYLLHFGPGAKARKVCNHLEDLCGGPMEGCADDLAEANEHELAEVERCVLPADSCLETVGCLAGSAMRELGQGAMRGLLR